MKAKILQRMATILLAISNIFVIIAADILLEPKNTPLYHSRLPRSEVLLIAKHSMEKTSIRGVSRVLDHHRDTISKYYHLIGKHAEILNDHYIRGISPGDCEFDEIWSFIQKKQKPPSS